MSCLEASKSFLKSLVSFMEEKEVPTPRHSRRRRKSKQEWLTLDPIRTSLSMPKVSRNSSQSLDSIKEFSPQELAIVNWTFESKPMSSVASNSKVETLITVAALPEQHPSLVTKTIREEKEQDAFFNPKESANSHTLEIQNFKFHDLRPLTI